MIYTSTGTTNYYHFDPKFTVKLPTGKVDEATAWVRENCKGGYQFDSGWGNFSHVKLQSESDYLHYILKWA